MILWVPSVYSPVRMGVPPAFATLTEVYSQKFWVFSFPRWNPGFCGLSLSQVVLPGLSVCECGTAWSTSPHITHAVRNLAMHPVHQLPISAPPTSLDDCFLNSLFFRLPCSLIFLAVLFLFFNWLLTFFWLCKEAKCFYLYLHLSQNSLSLFFLILTDLASFRQAVSRNSLISSILWSMAMRCGDCAVAPWIIPPTPTVCFWLFWHQHHDWVRRHLYMFPYIYKLDNYNSKKFICSTYKHTWEIHALVPLQLGILECIEEVGWRKD